MPGFEERFGLTLKIEQYISKLFVNDEVHPFGCTSIVNKDSDLFQSLGEPEVNQMPSGMIIKFAPDFILYKKSSPRKIYFLDVKHSVSPIYAETRLEKMRKQCNDGSLQISDVGVVAREALLSYRRYYPDTIILMASPYNKKLLMAQFASQVKCIYCFRAKTPDYDCNSCPWKKGTFFDIERDNKSNGSKTPMTNIDLRSFVSAYTFFKNLGIYIDYKTLKKMENIIMEEPLKIDDSVPAQRKQEILKDLAGSSCIWLKNWYSHEVYSHDHTSYIHFDPSCSQLKNEVIQKYSSVQEAKCAGKKKFCKYCDPR